MSQGDGHSPFNDQRGGQMSLGDLPKNDGGMPTTIPAYGALNSEGANNFKQNKNRSRSSSKDSVDRRYQRGNDRGF
jgi:hypothetical protein